MTSSIERDQDRPATRTAPARNAGQVVLTHHVIARHEAGGLELLRLPLESGGDTLPVFSSEVAARAFLLSHAPGREWHARESCAGELVSLLLGLCAGVEWVLIDPLPGERAAGEDPAEVVHWSSFVHYLLGGSECRLSPMPPRDLLLAGVDDLSREGFS